MKTIKLILSATISLLKLMICRTNNTSTPSNTSNTNSSTGIGSGFCAWNKTYLNNKATYQNTPHFGAYFTNYLFSVPQPYTLIDAESISS